MERKIKLLLFHIDNLSNLPFFFSPLSFLSQAKTAQPRLCGFCVMRSATHDHAKP